jgi:DNA polymerase alpha subunit B N-terminal
MAMATADPHPPSDSLTPPLEKELLEYFPASLLSADSAPLLAEVLSILRIYNLTPSDLADKWESFCLNKKHLLTNTDGGERFDLENVRELKRHLQGELERETRGKRSSMGTPVVARGGGKMGMADDMYTLLLH